MLSEGGQDRIVLICTSCKQNRLKMQEVDFSSCHSKVSQAGWLRKEIYSPALGKLEVQSQSVGRAMLPLKPLGEDPSLSLPAPGGPSVPWTSLSLPPSSHQRGAFIPVCPCVFLLFLYKNTSHTGIRTTLVGPHLNQLYLQIRSHAEVLEIRTSTPKKDQTQTVQFGSYEVAGKVYEKAIWLKR